MLRDESRIGVHAALTPTWSETAQYADYVLPMGVGAERHDLLSQETHAAKWISFRQPVLRVARERMGDPVEFTWQANPGEVWEEDEFWIELSWRIDPDGSLGIRRHYESPYRPGEKITIDEYYQWIFEHSVPGCPRQPLPRNSLPLAYMRKYGAFLVQDDAYRSHESPMEDTAGTAVDADGTIRRDGNTRRARGRGQARGRVPHAEPTTGTAQFHDARLEVGRADHARLHPQPCSH